MKKQSDYRAYRAFLLLGAIVCMAIFSTNFACAVENLKNAKLNEEYTITQFCSDASYINISISNINGLIATNVAMTSLGGGLFTYNFTPTELGRLDIGGVSDGCDNTFATYLDVTPNGNPSEDSGQLSSSIVYFYAILGLTFLFIGYLFLRHESVWVSYSGLFMMILGFAFFYYDLHLTNLYANTIAINSGAENVTSGAFIMIVRFIKIAPYIVAGIIAFFSVRTLREAISKKKTKDGWDDDKY